MSAGTHGRGPFRRALSHAEFRVVAGGLAVSAAGTWLYNVALVVFIYERTGSAGWVAAATMLRMAPAVLFGALGGVIADRYERRAVMISSDVTRAALQLGLAGVALGGGPPALAVLLAFLSTTAGQPFRPAAGAMTPLLVGADDLAAANSLLITIDNVALVLGPAAGGILLAIGSPGYAFLFNGLSFVVSAASVATIRTRSRPPREATAAGALRSMAVGARALRHTPCGPLLTGFMMGTTLIYGAETVLLVVVSQQLLGTGSRGLGYLLAAVGFGSVVAAGVASRMAEVSRPALPLAVGLVAMGAPVAFLPLVHHAWIAVALMVVQGFGVVVIDVMVPTLLQRAIDPAVIGRVLGTVSSVVIAASLLGSLSASFLVNGLGLTASLIITGTVVPALAVASLPQLRRLAVAGHRRSVQTDVRLKLLGGLAIFDGLGHAALEAVAASARDERVAAGAVVIREGDTADAFFVVRSGDLTVTSWGEAGAVLHVITLGPGDYFGEIGLLEGIPRTATVTARSESELLRIAGDDFLELVENPGVRGGIMADGMTARLARTHPSLAGRHAAPATPTR